MQVREEAKQAGVEDIQLHVHAGDIYKKSFTFPQIAHNDYAVEQFESLGIAEQNLNGDPTNDQAYEAFVKTADDVAQAFWKVLDKYGIEKRSRTGYSIGIGYPPDWGEHTLNIYKGDMTVLKPNVCFHMIAVMQFGDWGVEASEAIRVTDKGSELFCNMSKELHVKS